MHNVLATRAIELHRDPPAWDSRVAPSAEALGAWAIGAVGKGAPVPPLPALGATRIDVLERHAAAIRYRIGGVDVTYLVRSRRPDLARAQRGRTTASCAR